MSALEENKLGTERVSRLVLSTGVPLMLSLVINSLYNFVDSLFVSRISEEALTGLSLAAPIQLLVSALGLGNAVGLNAVISKALGENDEKQVRRAADASIFIALCSWLLISAACLLFARRYYVWQSGGDETLIRYGVPYLTVCMLFSFGQMGQWVFDRFVIASGRSSLFLFTLSAASITNLILDPIFIFGLFGLPRMETLGAAVATVIGQMVGMLAGIVINKKWNREIPFGFTLRPDGKSIREILKVGVPSTLVQVLTSFVAVLMNTILIAFSNTAVAVYGICARLSGIVLVGVHGIDNGLIPIVAYNYGVSNKSGDESAAKRVSDAVKWALVFSVLFYLVFFGVLELAPGAVLGIFDASDHMLRIGTPALRVMALAWLASIPALVMSAGLQGLSMGMSSMVVTMARQAVLPLIFAFALSRTGELDDLWFSFVLAELAGLPLAVFFWKRGYRKGLREPLA